MLRLFPLRRSFSLDLAPDDSNSNFFLHVNDESNDDHNNDHHHHQHHNNTSPNQCPNSPQQQSPSNYAKMSFLANPSQTTTITNLTTILTSSSTISSATTAAITTQRLSSVVAAASSLSSPSSPTSSSLSPSPSSSGPASSCSIHPINEEDEEEDDNDDEEEEGEEEEEEEDQNHNNNNTQSRNNEHANNDHHQHPNHHHHLTSSNMSSALGHWTVDEIDDALAADFDGSLSGLGIELGTASFNMSEALMALPSLSSLKHNLHHHHHHHHNHANGQHPHGHHGHQHSSSGGGNNNNNNNQDHNHHSHSGQNGSNNTSFILASSLQSIRNHPLHPHDDDDDDGDRNAHQNHHHHHNQLATSLDRNSSNNQNNNHNHNHNSNNNGNNGSQQTINSNNNQSNNSGNGNMDEKPIAVVHGKKNRLAAYGNDDEQLSTNSIKRFCLNTSEREQQLNTTITTTATTSAASSSSSSSLSSSTASTTSSNNHSIHLLIPNNAHHLICDGGDPHHHHHHHHGHIHLQNHQCNENCLNNHGGVGESLCHLRHSSSVPDLRTGGSTTTATIGVGGNLIVHGPSSSNGVTAATPPTTTTTTVIGGGAYSPQATLMNSSADSSPTSSSSISTTPTTTFFPHLISSSSSSPTCLSGGQIVNGGVGFMMDHHHHHRSDPHSGAGNVGNSVPTSVGNGTGTVATVCNNSKQSNEQSKFQYVLGASTSMAIKMNEETMTYLNQGQSYEIKLKKVGDLSEMKGKMLKTILRVCFHDRRLQYIEKELIEQWKEQRPSERVLEVDVPLSYGINDVRNDLKHINRCEFYWDPTKETGVFIRINCISTEFTPKKHGGEKGVPFRVLIETYSKDDPAQCLHAASCQVKVFKPKGADRKHKTDREKMNRKPVSELEKYQSSYDCTVFTDCSMDSFVLYNLTNATTFINDGNNYGNELVHTMAKSNSADCLNNDQVGGIEVADVADQIHKRKSSSNIILSSPLSIDKQHSISSNDGIAPSTTSITNGNPNPNPNPNNNNNNNLISDHNNHQKLINNSISQISLSDISDNNSYEYPFSNFSPFQPATALTLIGGSLGNGGCSNNGGGGRQRFSLTPSASWEDTQKWLKDNRFDAHLVTFENFAGTDFFQLTKEDLIQICGLTDGIRLFNALHLKNVKSKLSLYVCLATDEIFRAIYLDTLTLQELQSKLIYNLSPAKCTYLRSFCIMGPSGVKILMTDDVVRNLIDESLFIVDFTKDFKGEFHAVMKPYNQR